MGEALFGVNRPDVMHETIEGEVIAINLVSGNYYSLRGSGAEVWVLVSEVGPIGTAELADALAARYATPRAEIEAEVARFLAELAREGLVAPREPVEGASRPVLAAVGEPRDAFEPPSLETYSDMQDLVLLDPVHQVDHMGWPRKAADAEDEPISARRSA